MKRWIVMLAGLAAALLIAPSGETDVAALRPVEVLSIYKEEGQLYVETDTEDLGRGADLPAALEDLKATTPGEIFLETAQYVMVTPETSELLTELKEILRPAAEVVLIKEKISAQSAAKFLAVHDPGLALKDYASGKKIPELTVKEGRCYLAE